MISQCQMSFYHCRDLLFDMVRKHKSPSEIGNEIKDSEQYYDLSNFYKDELQKILDLYIEYKKNKN